MALPRGRATFALIAPLYALGCSSVTESGPEGSSTTTGASSTTGDDALGTTTGTDPEPQPETTTDPFEPAGSSTGTSASTGDTGTSTGDTGDGEPGCAFLCPDDDPTGPFECSLWEQDCPPGQKCAPWANDGGSAWNATRCSPVDPNPDADGEPCTVEGNGVSGIDSCEVGAMCWDVDPDTNVGTCVPHCTGSEDAPVCADPARSCSISAKGPIALCWLMCDPLDPQACGADQGCYRLDNGFVCGPDASGKGGGPFESCEFINACDPGTVCTVAEDVGLCGEAFQCCTPFCDLAAPNCPADTSCVPAFEDGSAPPGFESVGICLGGGG